MYGEQVEFGAREWKGVDPGELLTNKPLPAWVTPAVEALRRRKHQAQLSGCRPGLLRIQKTRKDHKTIASPVPHRSVHVHLDSITGTHRRSNGLTQCHVA
ncbi:hypothetical protein GCM10010201_19100 [Pilimelia columellifera subsp. columellifera]|uniref:Uncharacterized protein n=1 Tax=Pilimelia columellifera subsp. columellifera TaxID=706583 RepID=A0ABN3NH76_9ACTN